MPWRETTAELGRARAEEAVTIPSPAGTLFGIHTPPDPGAAPAGYCVVLFTRPRSHRNRIWVEGARRLATRGFGAFRFDYHGTGDSEGETGFLDPNRPYLDDARAVLAMLRERYGYRRFLVLGACFDARTALSTFVDRGAGVEGMVFFAAPLMELETLVKADADHRKDWKHVIRALGNPENWVALAKPERWRYMATVLGRVARGGKSGEQNDTPLSDSFMAHWRALVASGARALFVYGEADAEYASFKVALDTVFSRLSPAERARFEVEVWPGDVHGFVSIPLQRRVLEHSLGWIERFHPQAHAHNAANGAPGAGRS